MWGCRKYVAPPQQQNKPLISLSVQLEEENTEKNEHTNSHIYSKY